MREVEVGGAPDRCRPDRAHHALGVRGDLRRRAGAALADLVTLRPAEVLARHAWARGGAARPLRRPRPLGRRHRRLRRRRRGAALPRLLRAGAAASTTRSSGPSSAPTRPSLAGLVGGAGWPGSRDLWRITPFATLWRALGDYFHDPRLRQLFGRYATYCGSSPFLAPATLMLVAHVEQEGVWLVEGGMHRLAAALAELARARGAASATARRSREILVSGGRAAGVRLADGERIEADAVDRQRRRRRPGRRASSAARVAGAVPADAPQPSARCRPSPGRWWPRPTASRCRATTFLLRRLRAEFDDIFRHGRLPPSPRSMSAPRTATTAGAAPTGPERLLCLVNAPARRRHPHLRRMRRSSNATSGPSRGLARCGLRVDAAIRKRRW